MLVKNTSLIIFLFFVCFCIVFGNEFIQNWKVIYSLVSGVTNLTNKHPFPQANCLQILVESPSILSLQIFATGPTFLTINQTHYDMHMVYHRR
jgi:hypothetical protein